MGIGDRASDIARTISNDNVCSRRLIAGTMLAGGLVLPSVAVAPATAADLVIKISLCTALGSADRIINDGTCPLNNSGTVTNDSTHMGAVNNTGAAAVVTNSATGTWTGDLLSNTGGARVNNLGTWNGDANNASIVVNSGIWNTTANGFTNSGTLTTTGTLNAAAGGLTNTGTVNAQGLISGNIANIGPGTFTVTGPLSAGGGNFSNGNGAVLNLGANTFNDIGTLTNSAGGIVNTAGGTIGAITTVNAGTINVTGLSTINGALTNSGLINLQNNVAGDRLTITGNFVGASGSRIALDTTDQIVIGGSATGSTTLNVAGLAPGNLFTIGPNLVVVQGATSPSAFNLGNGLNFGTSSVVLVSQATATGVTFATATVASAAGLSGSIATSAVQTTSFVSNGVAFDRMADLRNSFHRDLSQGPAFCRDGICAGIRQKRSDQPLRASRSCLGCSCERRRSEASGLDQGIWGLRAARRTGEL